MDYRIYFSKLGFDFKTNLESRQLIFDKNKTLTDKLRSSVFFYKSPNNTNTSFYLIVKLLNDTEFYEVRKYIWNRNDADLIFYYHDKDSKLEMSYAKYSPKISYKDSILESFSTSENDLVKIDKIKQWRFDSGVFWLNYRNCIDKAKYKGIDKELVYTLKALKERLYTILINLISEETKCNEVVQALIDRTLYIKYLEDNHIINSHFYRHYFRDATLNYEKLLENNSDADLNKLFKKIHEIFNNNLFDQPSIDDKFLTEDIRNLISTSFKANLNTGQLRLYDFRFDVLPVEFISYVYEVFLSEKQKENGIYYTPKKLAQLIVDEVINEDKIGTILDPSSGSGMFLIVGYQRLLEIAKKQGLEPKDSIGKIKFRTKLLSDNIFGIEKELTAQRFTFFSLSLQIFEGINPTAIKDFIANELNEKDKVDLFSEFSFFENIKHANTLNISEKPFENKQFSYLLGNPPFFEIPNTDEFKDEISFLNSYKVNIINGDKALTTKQIVGKYQISQCFFLKIKDWSNANTRCGFVSNSSNFYNDYSNNFQEYFYSNYGIEKIYELSRVKKILFEKAKESVVAIIFTNKFKNNITKYYPVDLGLFSEKPFELLIIQEDKAIQINQKELISKKIRLRDFLIGNENDISIFEKLNKLNTLNELVLKTNESVRGIQVWGDEAAKKEYSIELKEWRKLKEKEKENLKNAFMSKYFSNSKNSIYQYGFYKPNRLLNFNLLEPDLFFSDKSNFDKIRSEKIFEGEKILWNRIGKIKAVYSSDRIYYDFDIYSFRLKERNLYHLITAILNSNIVNFYVNLFLRKRVSGSYPKIGQKNLLSLPIPNYLDKNLTAKISQISKDITEGKIEYSEKEDELNELIYELYELSYWEKQRVIDYFLLKERIGRNRNKLESYKTTIKEVLSFYLKNSIIIEETPADFNLIVIKISLNNNSDTPKAYKTKKLILNEIFEHNPNSNFLASQEKIYGNDCVYIIKEDINKNWTETKAFEDGQDILKHIKWRENILG